MARTLSNVQCYIETDKDGNPQGAVLWSYNVADGDPRKAGYLKNTSPDFGKTMHNTGIVGEFWRDGIDAIKTAEGI